MDLPSTRSVPAIATTPRSVRRGRRAGRRRHLQLGDAGAPARGGHAPTSSTSTASCSARCSTSRRSTRCGLVDELDPPDDIEVSGMHRRRVAASWRGARWWTPPRGPQPREARDAHDAHASGAGGGQRRWREGSVEPRRTLADFLREDLDLTGTHVACENGFCGNCNVLVDGETVRSCLMFAVQADGRSLADRRRAGRDATDAERAAAGLQRQPWPPVRLLHAGDAHHRARVPARPSGRRHRRARSATRSAACLAAAPATSTSSSRSGRRRPVQERHEHRRAGSERRQGRPRDCGRGRVRGAGWARA